jgi:hypothetical protein
VAFATDVETDESGATSRAVDGAAGSAAAFTTASGAALVSPKIVLASGGAGADTGAKTSGATSVDVAGKVSSETEVEAIAEAVFTALSLDPAGAGEDFCCALAIMGDCTLGAAASAAAAHAVAVPSLRKVVADFGRASKRWRCSSGTAELPAMCWKRVA